MADGRVYVQLLELVGKGKVTVQARLEPGNIIDQQVRLEGMAGTSF